MKDVYGEVKGRIRDLALVCRPEEFSDEEVIKYCEMAWDEIWDLEYEQAFGGWRGVHLVEEEEMVVVTFDNRYGGPPLQVNIYLETKRVKLDYPRRELIEKEEDIICELMKAAGVDNYERRRYFRD
jgi:hypothetical protein